LDEGVEVLDLVVVLGGVGVDASHALAFGGAEDADLRAVDIVVDTWNLLVIYILSADVRGQSDLP
jgi:hypothetical protein